MLMLGALILGASVARTACASIASARQERDGMLARAAAEAALSDAQADIAGGLQPLSARAAWFAAGSGGFAAGCGQGNQDLGLCLPAAPPAPAVWQIVDLADPVAPAVVPYGRYTGATLALGMGVLPSRLPGYVVERLAPGGAGPPPAVIYRVTAIGFGARDTTRVVLQALLRKALPVPPAAAPAASPAVRVGWREVVNWPELHARALP